MSMTWTGIRTLLLWSLPLTSLIGSLCYGAWCGLARHWELKASGITIYRWLKLVVLLWALPLFFVPLNLYLQNRVGWGITDGSYFQNLIRQPIVENVLIAVWAAGVGLRLIGCLIVWIRDQHRLRALPKVDNVEWQQDAAKLATELGIRRSVELRQGPVQGSPQMVGISRPVVIISRTDLTAQERRIVLYHEMSHYKHRDLWWQIAMELMICLNWFNPLCYGIRKKLTLWCETACDAWACRQRGERFTIKEYGQTVLSFCHQRHGSRHLVRTMGERMTAKDFIRRIQRLCVADQIWKEKNYRPACCVALIMAVVLLAGAGSVYGVGQTSDVLAQKEKEVIVVDDKPTPFPQAELRAVKEETKEYFKGDSLPLVNTQHNLFDLKAGESVLCTLQVEKTGNYVIGLMTVGGEYEVYLRDSEQQVWCTRVSEDCIIPLYIEKGKEPCLRVRSIQQGEVSFCIGWYLLIEEG